MDFLPAFEKIAPYLTHSLVLVGFALLLAFSIHRALIKSGSIPPLSKSGSSRAVQLLPRYGLLLALAAIALSCNLTPEAPEQTAARGTSGEGQVVSGDAPAPVFVRASRLFAGREQYPPKDFAAYGLVAFRSLPTPHDRGRYLLVCEAYAATLPHADDLPMVPPWEQMVTVWPVKSSETADALNGDTSCNVAVDAYDLVVSLQAIREAEVAGARIAPSGRGPYLLAWSPGKSKGSRGAPVLVADLSGIETYDDVKAVFVWWENDIEKNPELWSQAEGWSVEKVRTLIRGWADRWGPHILSLLSWAS